MRGGPARVYLSLSPGRMRAQPSTVRRVFLTSHFPSFWEGRSMRECREFRSRQLLFFPLRFLNVTENVSYRVSCFSSVSPSLFSKRSIWRRKRREFRTILSNLLSQNSLKSKL